MTDKELLYQILSRDVDNILGQYVPQMRIFSGTISRYMMNLIDPYVDAFLQDDDRMNSQAATAFMKQKASAEIQSFMDRFNQQREDDAM